MKTFYTTIKIALNALSGDMLSIGLLLYDGEKLWLQFSEERRTLTKKLLHDKHNMVDFLVKQIGLNVSETNSLLAGGRAQLFDLQDIITSENFAHLSNYSNGIIRFSTPAFLNDTIDEDKFQKLFSLFVSASEKEIQPINIYPFQGIIQQKLIDKVADRVHTNLELTPDILPGIYYNFTIDCLGKNGSLIGAKSISFNSGHPTLDKELGHYFALISLLDKQESRKVENDSFYIFGQEPDDINSKQHKTWESILKNPVVKMLHPEEADIVTEQILRKGATKFLEEV